MLNLPGRCCPSSTGPNPTAPRSGWWKAPSSPWWMCSSTLMPAAAATRPKRPAWPAPWPRWRPRAFWPWRARALPRRSTKTRWARPGPTWARASMPAPAATAAAFSLRSLTDPRCWNAPRCWPRARWASPAGPPTSGSASAPAGAPASSESAPAPATVAGEAFATAVYGSHPYGQRATEDTLARIEVADMQALSCPHHCRLPRARQHRGRRQPRPGADAGGHAAGHACRSARGRMRPLPAVPECSPHRTGRAAHSLRLGPGPCADRPARLCAPRPGLSGAAGGQPHPGRRRFHRAPDQRGARKARPELQRVQRFCARPACGRLHHRPADPARPGRAGGAGLARRARPLCAPKAPPRPSCVPPRTT
jgi:hypothetical protein